MGYTNKHEHVKQHFRWYNSVTGGEQVIITCSLCHRGLSEPLETARYTERELFSMPVLYKIGDRPPFVLWGATEYIYNEWVRARANLKLALSLMSKEQREEYKDKKIRESKGGEA